MVGGVVVTCWISLRVFSESNQLSINNNTAHLISRLHDINDKHE